MLRCWDLHWITSRWSFRWFDDKRRKNYDIKLSSFEVNTFNLLQNSIASFKLQRFNCLNWKGFLSIRTYHTIKLIRDLKKNFGKTNSRNDGCESILNFFFPPGIRHLTTEGGNSVRNHQNLKKSQITFYNLVCENKILNILNCVYTKSRNH